MSAVATEHQRSTKSVTGLVDCDVHITMPSEDILRQYLPERWRRHHDIFGGNPYHAGRYPRAVPNAARVDAWPPSGAPPGSDLDFMRQQLLDVWDISYAILGPLVRGVQAGVRNVEYAAAISSAANDWAKAEWLDRDDRLRSSIVTPFEAPDLAAREINRCASDTRFVQVYLQVQTASPLGNRKYWPIYEAAVQNDLPVGVHFGGLGGNANTGSGWNTYYLEDHTGNAQTFQSQVISLVFEGVFERFPELRIVLIEGGMAWLPPLAWRLDRAFEQLGAEVPHLKRLPSEYIADHIWLTTQPIEEPPDKRGLGRVLEAFPSLEDRLMLASDYPHWDFDAPDEALRLSRLPRHTERKVISENARRLYRLP